MSWVAAAVHENTIIKISMGNYHGESPSLKKILIKPISIKKVPHWNIIFRHKTNDITKNIPHENIVPFLSERIDDGFRIATVFTATADYLYENIHDKKIVIKSSPASQKKPSSALHDKQKERLIPTDRPYLQQLKITNATGEVYKATQDKYRQINHFITLMKPIFDTLNPEQALHIADMGAGKGYLTFALYDYMSQRSAADIRVTGVELRPDLVEQCNTVAKACGYSGLKFERAAIQDYQADRLDGLIALHACNTATDDAIASAIRAQAQFVVVAPCCHKQIRREMTQSKSGHVLSSLTRHGIFLERQAEMLTDTIRILVMEYFGYKVAAMEFISDSHTPKNVMLRAIKTQDNVRTEKLDEIRSLMSSFGINQHYLVEAMSIK